MPERPRPLDLGKRIADLEEKLRQTTAGGLVLAGSTQVVSQVEGDQANPNPASWLNQGPQGIELIAGIYDVRRYGAPDNGASDAGPAIQSAVNDADAGGGGIVLLSRRPGGGHYVIDTPVTVPEAVTVAGVGWNTFMKGTVVRVRDTSVTPFTLVGRGATLRDFAIVHEQPTPGGGWTPATYPFAVRVQADDCWVHNLFMFNPTRGIRVAPATDSGSVGRVRLTHIFGQPLLTGLEFERCLDVCYTDLVHFWPFWSQDASVYAYQFANADAVRSGRNDNPKFVNIFGIVYRRLFHFFASTGTVAGPTHKFKIVNADADACATGIYIDGALTAGHASNLTHGGNATIGSTTGAIHCVAADAYLGADNVRSSEATTHMIRWEGSNSVLHVDNLWAESWNMGGSGAAAIHAVSPAVVRVGFQRRFTGGGGAAQTGGTGTIQLDA